jgi:uncharacterized damage-inducible protein DinB
MAAAIDKLAFADLSAKPEGVPWTLWELFEHIRIAQWDIVEFSKSAEHQSPEFPKGYWPESSQPQDADAWEQSVASFRRDLASMKALVLDPEVDLHAKIPHGDGQTILREAMLVADHNTYHLGQMVLVMKMLGRW